MAQSAVSFREPQSLQQDRVTVIRKRLALENPSALFGRFKRISCEHPLVNQLRRTQRRPIAKHDLEELEPLDMPSHEDQAYRQRCRYHQSDWTPEPGPE